MRHYVSMIPEELAERHPRIYHITEPGAWSSIQRHGLLSTSRILELFEIEALKRVSLETRRRAVSIPLHHPRLGSIVLNDQKPLTEEALKGCLEDHLKPEEWLKLLSSRVFFWPSEENLHRHLNARLNRTRSREIIVVDTLSLSKVYAEKIELCPINSGVTFRKAARRGKSTFTPMLKYSYADWSKLRGGKDKVQEIVVLDQIPDIADHVIEVYEYPMDVH